MPQSKLHLRDGSFLRLEVIHKLGAVVSTIQFGEDTKVSVFVLEKLGVGSLQQVLKIGSRDRLTAKKPVGSPPLRL